MSDTEHHWAVVPLNPDEPHWYECCPLIIADDGHAEGVMIGLTLITDLESLKKRAWTITEFDDMEEPTTSKMIWAAEGHGTREMP